MQSRMPMMLGVVPAPRSLAVAMITSITSTANAFGILGGVSELSSAAEGA